MIARRFNVGDFVRINAPVGTDWHFIDGLRAEVESRSTSTKTIHYGCVIDDEASPHHRKSIVFKEEDLLGMDEPKQATFVFDPEQIANTRTAIAKVWERTEPEPGEWMVMSHEDEPGTFMAKVNAQGGIIVACSHETYDQMAAAVQRGAETE